MKKIWIGIVIGGLYMTMLTTYALSTLYEAKVVGYDNTNSGTNGILIILCICLINFHFFYSTITIARVF